MRWQVTTTFSPTRSMTGPPRSRSMIGPPHSRGNPHMKPRVSVRNTGGSINTSASTSAGSAKPHQLIKRGGGDEKRMIARASSRLQGLRGLVAGAFLVHSAVSPPRVSAVWARLPASPPSGPACPAPGRGSGGGISGPGGSDGPGIAARHSRRCMSMAGGGPGAVMREHGSRARACVPPGAREQARARAVGTRASLSLSARAGLWACACADRQTVRAPRVSPPPHHPCPRPARVRRGCGCRWPRQARSRRCVGDAGT